MQLFPTKVQKRATSDYDRVFLSVSVNTYFTISLEISDEPTKLEQQTSPRHLIVCST